jgi:negative regulator of genetic competence, sporulation and motility
MRVAPMYRHQQRQLTRTYSLHYHSVTDIVPFTHQGTLTLAILSLYKLYFYWKIKYFLPLEFPM